MSSTGDWAWRIQPGDLLCPAPLWNQTERWDAQLPDPCTVLEVVPAPGTSQSGILLVVRTRGGQSRQLDAGWFSPVPLQTELFS